MSDNTKEINKLKGFIGQLDKISSDLEVLHESEYEEVCDATASIVTYIRLHIQRLNKKED